MGARRLMSARASGDAELAACARLCQNQDFQDFAFAQPALFAATANPAKTNGDERLPHEDAPDES